MQRDFLRERPDGISGGQPDLTDKALAFPEPTMKAGTSSTAKLRLRDRDYRFADTLQRKILKVERLFSMSNRRLAQDDEI